LSAITTHVLDTARGRPAAGLPVVLEQLAVEGGSVELGSATTDIDGRVRDIGPAQLEAGRYRLVFGTTAYFASIGQTPFFPEVSVTFGVSDPAQHYHVPLLLSAFAYSTYRGS
jgi:5-hydroxyisourate hydrolase